MRLSGLSIKLKVHLQLAILIHCLVDLQLSHEAHIRVINYTGDLPM
jgi:hypothetical protein